jgi:hypothetical protein
MEMTENRLSSEEANKIIDWFLSKYEDSAENTPYESAEGGYQYIWGGPFDAEEVIEEEFAYKASKEAIVAAIKYLRDFGTEWAPIDHGEDEREPNDYEGPDETIDDPTEEDDEEDQS